MLTSTFGWLDYDDGERRRMMELIDVFREKSILDELGIGTIRDTFADHFFPGTSTIQTRARYFLFIPWLYRQIEDERVPSNRATARARALQWTLVQSLKAGEVGSDQGVIGYEAGKNLQRLPSSIYWMGLRRWGIRRFDGSIEQYHASLNQWYVDMRAPRLSDGGELLITGTHNWRETLPPRPESLLDAIDFQVRREEAEFLIDRIHQDCAGTLLSALLTPEISGIRRARAPWNLGGLDRLEPELRRDIEDARLFSLGMEGATLLYNLMLAEHQRSQGLATSDKWIDSYREDAARWSDEVSANDERLIKWDRTGMWDRLRRINPRINPRAIHFSDTWISRATADPRAVIDDVEMRELIVRRERGLKGALARLTNARALEKWSGASGLGKLTFRWGSAQQHAVDILDGLKRPVDGV